MSDADGYIPWSPRIVCSTCGDLVRKDDTRVLPGNVRSCNTNCSGERSAVELSRANARQKPFLYRPVKNARPEDNTGPASFEADEGPIFNFIARAIGYGTRYESVTNGDIAPAAGDQIGMLAWSSKYLYDIIVENERPLKWISQATALLRTCASTLMANQIGFGLVSSATRANNAFFGAIQEPGADVFVTENAATGGLALLYAFRVTGDIAYRAGARAAASYLRNVQAIGEHGTRFTSVDAAGLTRLNTGGLASYVSTATGFYSSHAFYPSSLLALNFWNELLATDGDQSIGATAVVNGFDTVPAETMSEAMAALRVFWRVGTPDTGTSTNITGLSATTPREFFNAYPAVKPSTSPAITGSGCWEYADGDAATGTTVTGSNFAKALAALFAYEDTSAQVVEVDDWLRSFASNAALETPVPSPPLRVLARSETGTFDPTMTLTTDLLVRDSSSAYAATKKNATSLYDWGAFGLLSDLWNTRHGSSFATARLFPLGRNQRFYDGTRSDGDHFDYIELRGKSGLSLQTAFVDSVGTPPTVDLGCSDSVYPSSLPSSGNIVFRFRSDFGLTLVNVIDEYVVSSWADSTGNGWTVTQSNPTRRPLYVDDALNGFPGVNFRLDAQSNLNHSGATPPGVPPGVGNPLTPGAARTFMAVVKPAGTKGGAICCIRQSTLHYAVAMWTNPVGAPAGQYVYDNGSSNIVRSAPVDYTNTPIIIAWVDTGSTMTVYVNGVAISTTTSTTAAENGVGNGLSIGNINSYAGLNNCNFDGSIIDVVCWNVALSGAEVRSANCNLAGRYNGSTSSSGMMNDAVRAAQFGGCFRFNATHPEQV